LVGTEPDCATSRQSYIFGLGYYLDTILFTIVVSGLAWRSFPPFIRHIDKVLGEWAYFVFLVQWLAGFAVALAFQWGQTRGWALFIAATPVALLASAELALLNRKFVEPIRDQVRDLSSVTVPALSATETLQPLPH